MSNIGVNGFKFNEQAMQQFRDAFAKIVSEGITEGFNKAWDSLDFSKLGEFTAQGSDAMKESAAKANAANEIREIAAKKQDEMSTIESTLTAESGTNKEFLDDVKETVKEAIDEQQEQYDSAAQESKRDRAIANIGMQALNMAAESSIKIFKGSFELIEGIYEKMKAASPLLQAVETLFSLAMQMFFMPLGNKLGEVLIPAVIDLLDKVVSMWDSFEGKTLGEIFAEGFSKMIGYLSDFFHDVGDELVDQGGDLKHIGNLMNTIGDFLESNGEKVITGILSFSTVVVENFKAIASLIAGFYTAYMAMQVASAFDLFGTGYGRAATAGVILAGTSATLATYGGLSAMGFAEGGHVDATPGGSLIRVAERGEGEWMIPDSKMEKITSGGDTYYITIEAYSAEDFEDKVESIISKQVSLSRLKSGY